MKTARKILFVLAIILLFLQIAAYLGNIDQDSIDVTGINAIYYYAGFNFPLILASIFFAISLVLKRKINKKIIDSEIDSIGKN